MFLRSTTALPGGMGGIVFFAKNGEADEWAGICQRLGRGADVVRITPGGYYGFNFMDWIAAWGEGGERGPIPTVLLLQEINSVLNPGANTGRGESTFWDTALRIKLTMLVLLAQLARLRVSLDLMNAISASAPVSPAQGRDPGWQKASICWQALKEAEAWTKKDPAARRDYASVEQYFLQDYASLDLRPKSSIDIMFSQLITPFLARPLRPLLCEETNITPELCFEGKIFLIDMPVQEYGLTAKLCAVAFKRCFQLAVMRRSGKPGSLRPVFLFADEAQNFITPMDTEYQAVARSAGGVTCLLTQQISSIREALNSKDKCENLTANLGTKIFCQNSGETAFYASQLIGERYTPISGITVGRSAQVQDGAFGDAGMSGGVSISDQKRAWIEPSRLQQLRRGGRLNGYEVDAAVFAGGKMFAGEDGPQPYTIIAFDQKG
jgi:hypothetical protein